jgi:hypothetical protein
MKKPILETLRLAIASLRQFRKKISNRGELVNSASVFENRANEAVKLFTAWTKHQTTTRLRDTVEGVHRVWMIETLDELLNCIPNNLMDPNLRTSLHNISRKVARYKEAARYLCRTAKRFPAVRRAEVVPLLYSGKCSPKMKSTAAHLLYLLHCTELVVDIAFHQSFQNLLLVKAGYSAS